MTTNHLPETSSFRSKTGSYDPGPWEQSPTGFEIATHVGREVLHRELRWKNSRHFSKKEKQTNSNYANQKIAFICTGISVSTCTEILSTHKLILQNFMHNIPPQITAIFTHGSIAHNLMFSGLPTAIWLPALSHLSAEFSHIWLTC